jgi:hypothetical protein
MHDSIDRWENEGGRHAPEAAANSRRVAVCGGHRARPQPATMAAGLPSPAAPTMPTIGADQLREERSHVARGHLPESRHYASVVTAVSHGSPQ